MNGFSLNALDKLFPIVILIFLVPSLMWIYLFVQPELLMRTALATPLPLISILVSILSLSFLSLSAMSNHSGYLFPFLLHKSPTP